VSNIQTDLVIQISTSEPGSDAVGRSIQKAQDSGLIRELRQCLQPGVEIALIFPGYMAMTSILWLTELQLGDSFRVGIRLLGVSALLGGQHWESAAEWGELPRRVVREQSDPPIVHLDL